MKKFASIPFVILLAIILTGCTSSEPEIIDNSQNGNMSKSKITKLVADNYCKGKDGQKSCPETEEEVVVLQTNHGDITIKLFTEEAPKTTANFKKLVKEGFYDGLSFHRIIKNFMIQGGDPSGDGTGGPGYTIDAEISPYLTHTAGAVATARLGDAVNPEKASSGSQFYIVHNDTGALGLDGEYTIFAQVVKGMNVVDKIANLKTDFEDKPTQEVIIEKAILTNLGDPQGQ